MTRRRTLQLPALLGTLAAAVLVACAVGLATLLAVSGEAEASFPGKNGRIAYNSKGVIYTINPDGSGKQAVTNTHVSGDPIDYSPDGKKISYSAFGKKHSGIYTIRARGRGKTKVAEGGDDPDYSPDGKKILYYTGNDLQGKIYTINVGGGGKSKVTEGSNPSWGTRP
jgi:Tol biopolymer transport system component